MKRREFNQLAAVVAANAAMGVLLPGCATSTVGKTTKSPTVGKGRVLATTANPKGDCSLRLMDWNTFHHHDFEIPLNQVHSIVQDKRDLEILYLFEGFGSAAKVNLKTGSIVKIDHRTGSQIFKGHGALASTHDFIACTEFDGKVGRTHLRSTNDLSVIGELPQECARAHQVVALPGTSLFATGNVVGDRHVISFYDYAEKKIVKQVDTEALAVHLMAYSSTEVFGASMNHTNRNWKNRSAPRLKNDANSIENMDSITSDMELRPAPLAYVKTDGDGRSVYDEKLTETFRMNFGLSKTTDGRLFSSHPLANRILVWKDFEIVRTIETPKPTSVQVSADGTEFLVLSNGRLKVYSLLTYEPIKTLEGWPAITTISSYV